MKACSKFFSAILVFVLIVSTFSIPAGAAITQIETPDSASLKWATQIGQGWQKPAGVPVLVNDNIVIMAGDEIYKVNSQNGQILKTAQMAQAQSYGYVAPLYADGKIFMNLSNGTVQAFDAVTLESKWVYTAASGGKGMTSVTYSDGTVYTGFWHSETKDADFVALYSNTGALKWSKTVNGGFYWAGAYCTDNAVIFVTDDGSDKIAHIYSCNKETGEIISQIDVENKGDIRSRVTHYNNRIYVTTKGGYLISSALDNGILSDVKYGEIGAASTSTPTIYDNRIYIGAGDKTISVFDANSLEKLFSVNVQAYPQCTPLISTHYADSEGYIYIYTTYNKSPGGITLVKIKCDAVSSDDCSVTELYDAKGYEQYCISDIICDGEGTLYYKNDSGYLMAVGTPSYDVCASFAEDGFVLAPINLSVKPTYAEEYGYTDTVTPDNASVLDVLVYVHTELFGEDFTPENATEYLIVSEEGYISKVIGIDTYNFGFAVNGKAPHDNVLTSYGYTGYSVNQAPVSDNDKVEFFIYRDSWAMDNYGIVSQNGVQTDHVVADKGEEIKLKLEGYSFGWYSCSEDSKIKEMTLPVSDAKILLGTEQIATTDDSGNFTVSFDSVGQYTLFAKEGEGATPLIPKQIKIDILGAELIEEDRKKYIVSNLSEETDVWVIKAYYDVNTMTAASLEKLTLPEGYSKTEIKVSDANVFVWYENLSPIDGGMIK